MGAVFGTEIAHNTRPNQECVMCGCETDQQCLHADGDTVGPMHYLCGVLHVIEDALENHNPIEVTMSNGRHNQDSLDFVELVLNIRFKNVLMEEIVCVNIGKRKGHQGIRDGQTGAIAERHIVFKFSRCGSVVKSAVKQ